MKLLFAVSFLFCSLAYADDMNLVKYEEVSDCNYPSDKKCIQMPDNGTVDEHGQLKCTIILNEKCRESEK